LLIFLAYPANGQYNYSEIEEIESEYSRYRLSGDFESASALVPDITHRIRISFGLYSDLQLPYLLEDLKHKRSIGDLDGSLDRAYQTRFIVGKHDDLDNIRRLILALIWLPDNKECLERIGWRPKKDGECIPLRRYIADSLILATQLQIGVAKQSGERDDYEALQGLANATAFHVLGIDGPEYIIEVTEETIYQSRNPKIRPRYNFETWEDVANDAEKEIISINNAQ